jgi:ABC-type oligopeptide transport system ATPase subunit
MKEKMNNFIVTFESGSYKEEIARCQIINNTSIEGDIIIDKRISLDYTNRSVHKDLDETVSWALIVSSILLSEYQDYSTFHARDIENSVPIVIHDSTKKLLQEKDDKIADLENLIDDLNKQLGYESVEASLHEAKGNTDA